jgi:hypothetical protein
MLVHQDFLDILALCTLMGCGVTRYPLLACQYPPEEYLIDALTSNYLSYV